MCKVRAKCPLHLTTLAMWAVTRFSASPVRLSVPFIRPRLCFVSCAFVCFRLLSFAFVCFRLLSFAFVYLTGLFRRRRRLCAPESHLPKHTMQNHANLPYAILFFVRISWFMLPFFFPLLVHDSLLILSYRLVGCRPPGSANPHEGSHLHRCAGGSVSLYGVAVAANDVLSGTLFSRLFTLHISCRSLSKMPDCRDSSLLSSRCLFSRSCP